MKKLYRNKYRIDTARLKGYDYSLPGAYFVTICTQGHSCYFGEIAAGEVILNSIGEVAKEYWREIPEHFPVVVLDEFVVMPNHVHGIVHIVNIDIDVDVETQNIASLQPPTPQPPGGKFGSQSRNLASIIRGFKVGVKKWATINNIEFMWQARFHDRIIREEDEFKRIRHYIKTNPENWQNDRYYKNKD